MFKKMNKTIIVCILIFVIFVPVFIYRFIYINNKYPHAVIQTCNVLELMDYNNFEITVDSYKFLDKSELIDSKYNDTETDDLFEKYDTKAVFVTITIKNTSDMEANIEAYMFALESPGWTNGTAYELFIKENAEDISMNPTLNPQQELTLTLPYVMYSIQFRDSTWENVKDRPFSLVLSLYPIKREIILQ